jgi:RNA polymerase sigma-70 factor (ECF subfamily)
MEVPVSSAEFADRDLIASARRGDLRAFNALVARWEKRVYNYLLRSTGNREDALDLCQEVFFKAYRGLNGLSSCRSFPNWLFRIAHNELVSAWRRAKPTVGGTDLERAADFASVPRARLGDFGYGGAELAFLVEQALNSLPEKQREVVVLKVHHGFKFREIAEILGCPVSTAKSRLYAALDSLRELLEPVSA